MEFLYRYAPFLWHEALWGITYGHLALGVAVCFAAWSWFARSIRRAGQRGAHIHWAHCSCGWSGKIGRRVKRCPTCGERLA